jgi:hypothetical protein
VYNYTDYELTNWKNVQDNSSLRVPQSCCSSKPLISYGDDDRENELFLEEGGAAATTRRWDDGDETDWLERCQSSNPMESGDFLYDQVVNYLERNIHWQSVSGIKLYSQL